MIIALLLGLAAVPNAPVPARAFAVTIRVDAGQSLGPLGPIWRFFGADEPNYAYMKDGRKLLAELGELQAEVSLLPHPQSADHRRRHARAQVGQHQRLHRGRAGQAGLRLDDRGSHLRHVSRTRRAALRADRLHAEGLSRQPEPYQHEWRPGLPYDEIYTGWAYPPKDYAKWAELVYQWAKHCVERYGTDEVSTWYWETWNEANIGYWRGTREEFLKLHDYAVDAVRRALPEARVGGPHTAGAAEPRVPPDRFRARTTPPANGHAARFRFLPRQGPPDVRRRPRADGHRRPARDDRRGLRHVASFPKLKQTPIVIGESDPEGCAACQGPQLAYRNGTMYSSYTAASFARKHDLAGSTA